MKSWLKKRSTATIVLAASIFASLVLLFALGALGGFAGAGANWSAWIAYYSKTLSGSLAGFFYDGVLFLCLVVIVLVIWSLGRSFLLVWFPKWRDANNKKDDPRKVFLDAAMRSREMLLIIPADPFYHARCARDG